MNQQLKLKFINLRKRLSNWQFTKLWYLDSYDDLSQEKIIMAQIPDYEDYLERKSKTIAARAGAPLEFLFMYAEPFLSKEQEQHLFRQYNFLKHKYKLLAQNNALKYNQLPIAIQRLENYYVQIGNVKQKLVCSNARLVMNLARKANVPNLEAGLSDGYLGLTIAVDYFDFRRGIKFITYGYLVVKDYIRKNRLGETKSAAFTNYDEMMDWELAAPNVNTEDIAINNERINVIKKSLLRIPPREREVISCYYGLHDGRTHTLDEIGKRLRISKERVRQIKVVGLERIKRIKRIRMLL